MRRIPFIHAILAALILASAFAMSGPAAAQTEPASPALEFGETAADATGDAESRQALEDLIAVLRDDSAREAFLTELEGALGSAAAGDMGGQATADDVSGSLGSQISGSLAAATASVVESVGRVVTQLGFLPQRLSALDPSQIGILMDTLIDVLLLVLVTYGILFGFRLFERWLQPRVLLRVEGMGPVSKVFMALGILIVGAVVVLIAAIAGRSLAVALSAADEPGLRHLYYLLAFTTVELFLVAAHVVLMPTMPWARLLALTDEHAKALHRHLRLLAMWLGYGVYLLVPSINDAVSHNTGNALTVVIYLLALAYVFGAILRGRQSGSGMLIAAAPGGEPSALRQFVAHFWHWPALIWVVVSMLVVLTRPRFIVERYLDASTIVGLAIVAGVVALGISNRLLAHGVPLPEALTTRLPGLQGRVDATVPHLLTLIRAVVVLCVLGFTLSQFELVDIGGLLNTPLGGRIVDSLASVAVVLAISALVWIIVEAWIDFRLSSRSRVTPTARERTLLALLRNAMIVIIIAVTAMFVLAELGINIAPLLASAGVVGLAIGFGAQKLIQDVITGIFIQLEGAIDVGDVVTVGGTSGVVERLTIRSVALRDLQGVYHIVPFSSVDMVSNYMRGFAYVVSEMSVAYRENVDEVKKAIYDAFEKLKELPEIRASILDEELEWMGLDRFGASEVVLRSRIKTLPGKQWETGRAFNAEIKKIFDERDIEIPFPHQTVYFGVDKKGEAPPMHVVNTGPPPKSAKPAPARPASSRRAPAKSTAAKKGAPRKRVRRGGSTPDMPDND